MKKKIHLARAITKIYRRLVYSKWPNRRMISNMCKIFSKILLHGIVRVSACLHPLKLISEIFIRPIPLSSLLACYFVVESGRQVCSPFWTSFRPSLTNWRHIQSHMFDKVFCSKLSSSLSQVSDGFLFSFARNSTKMRYFIPPLLHLCLLND